MGVAARDSMNVTDAEAVLAELASVFFEHSGEESSFEQEPMPNLEERYRALVEQIPAVVFMGYLDGGIGEAYVSPQIEKTLGFSQSEWLEDPIGWYRQIHPDDKHRWSIEAAEMFVTGKPLRSAYRVIARDGHVIWFHCEANMIRRSDGRPWFIHGVAFDITELKQIEAALEDERNVLSAILDTVGALVVVFDPTGRIVRFNRACEETTGYTATEALGRRVSELLLAPGEADRFLEVIERGAAAPYESYLLTRDGSRRLIRWSNTVLPAANRRVRYAIATGIDVTERKRLEAAVLEISGSEQRRIGQDLHDGLGQHLTGIAFLGKVLEHKLAVRSVPEVNDASKIVRLVNESIRKTRELARGLMPVTADSQGLMTALQQWANEVEDLFQISCVFECEENVLVHNTATANHLYRIAQEAVHNAIKHADARNIVICLAVENGGGVLVVEDNGCGILDTDAGTGGMGLRIMRYRAGMLGGVLEIRRCGDRGTRVICTFPM
jgi:PAS domain S-box-containing protein